jgi:TonB-dependent receptor
MKRKLLSVALAALPFARSSFLSASKTTLLHTIFFLCYCGPAVVAAEVSAVSAGTATLTGWVSNAATGDLLRGATVQLPSLGRSELTDDTGRYLFHEVPAGDHEIVATYAGLDAARDRVTVAAGVSLRRNFDLTSGVYRLGAFTVSGQREGAAAAITTQRNADNVKNVVSMDSYGDLPNMSAGEVAALLPGISVSLADDGPINGIMVRGMAASLNRVTVDGGMIAGGGLNRSFAPERYAGAMFDQLELTKGQTPDKGADSLGGSIDLKSRSPLSMREKRRVNYTVSARWAAPFTEQVYFREQHRVHPLINVGYQEVFGLGGSERNLGVSVQGFYSENVNGLYATNRDFENTLSTPAYLWNYQTAEKYNNRKQSSLKAVTDYRLSPATKFRLNASYVDSNEPTVRNFITTAQTTQQVGTSGTAGILPGYTNRITRVRAAAGSQISQDSRVFSVFDRTGELAFSGEHHFDRLQLDYRAGYSWQERNIGNGKSGAQLTNRISAVGWVLDRSQSDLYPSFVQTEGPDILNPANYRPIANGLQTRDNDTDEEVRELRANARYQLPTALPLFVKAGAQWRENTVDELARNRRWSYLGTAALPPDPALLFWDRTRQNRPVPLWEPSMFVRERKLVDPELWREDHYFREQTRFTGTSGVGETISAGYLMSEGRLGTSGLLAGTSYIAGVRVEKTETQGWGWVRARVPSTVAQQTADPVGSAERDYASNRRVTGSSYTKSFPSVHLAQNLGTSFKARLSWSTGFGRPGMNNFVPNETANEANQTLTINNPGLLPQTASNWDATLDYYFEPVGNFSVGWFHKTIKDFIITGIQSGLVARDANNGFGGEYQGFMLLTSANGGTAYVQGWEISYQQQFTFLPGVLRGLGLVTNVTILDTHGDFGGTAVRRTGEVAGFIPRSGNVILSWRHRRLSARVRVNYTGDFITNYSAASVARNLYVRSRTIVNTSLGFELRPNLSLTLDVANLTNAHQVQYRGITDQMALDRNSGTALTFGLSGRF